MISERDLRLAKAIVDPYIGQDIIATAVLGTKLGSIWIPGGFQAETDRFTGLLLSVGACVLPLTQ